MVSAIGGFLKRNCAIVRDAQADSISQMSRMIDEGQTFEVIKKQRLPIKVNISLQLTVAFSFESCWTVKNFIYSASEAIGLAKNA